MTSQRIAVIGAGPAGLAAADHLSAAGLGVDVYDRMPSVGRKFLMAGRGGLNLTHSEPLDRFLTRYGAASGRLAPALRAFPPEALRAFAADLGEPTFVGSSGRVFPVSFKASPLLRAWLRRLGAQGVRIHPRHAWRGWSPSGALRFATPDGPAEVTAAACILALGGASWPRLGADGDWVEILRARGVPVTDLAPANMGLLLPWSAAMRGFAGTPLKRIALTLGDRQVRGEAVVTESGLEGGAVYALSAGIRAALAAGPVTLRLDLRPDLDPPALAARIAAAPRKLSFANLLRRAAGLAPVGAALLREGMGPHRPPDALALAALIKAVPLAVTGTAGLARAISSAGGIAWDAIGDDYGLKAVPATFACGEMLDWEAPTGGYLLQACFATGRAAAAGARAFLAQPAKPPASR